MNTTSMLARGSIAPAFSLVDQNNQTHTLAQYLGQWVLLYFYPQDDTPGCTIEACTIRDRFSEFKQHQIVVLGISTNSADSHKKFETKYTLPFTLLADTTKTVRQQYAAKGLLGTKRISYLIDPQGVIAKIYLNVKPEEHAAEVLADVDQLQK